MAPAPAIRTAKSIELAIADLVASCHYDPLKFVLSCYPWQEPGALEKEDGPDDNQKEFLTTLGEQTKERQFNGADPVMPVLMSMTSGHGTGKSALGGWIVDWILGTRPYSIGTITAGTATQLYERTWAAIQFWSKLCITAPWFDIMASGIYEKKYPDDWKALCQSCRPENAQSFAGQHSKRGTSFYLFDEASEVADSIWKTALEGGLTDGEPMLFAWGQCVRNTGMLYEANFGKWKARFNTRRIDSRTSRFTNKQNIAQMIEDYGLESDTVKVRVLGYAPAASELQYIDKQRVTAARVRTQIALPDEPIVAGFDVSGGGRAWNVIRFRQGLNGRILPPIRIPGEHDPDRSQRVGVCAELLRDRRHGHRLAAMFVDAAFGAPIVVRLRSMGFENVYEVPFGGASPDTHQSNMRAYMHWKYKEWLLLGSIPDDDDFCDQSCLAGFHFNNASKLVIESKADIQGRGEKSPDDSDAFMLTFAAAVNARPQPSAQPAPARSAWG